MRADLYDAISFNTQASGNWAKKPPEIAEWPRPTVKPKGSTRVTVKDLWQRLSKRR